MSEITAEKDCLLALNKINNCLLTSKLQNKADINLNRLVEDYNLVITTDFSGKISSYNLAKYCTLDHKEVLRILRIVKDNAHVDIKGYWSASAQNPDPSSPHMYEILFKSPEI